MQDYTTSNWWQSYKTTHTTTYDPTDAEPDYRREDAIDAVLDAQYGYADGLVHMIAESVWPEDVDLAMRHMSTSKIPAESLDWALECLEHGEDVDLILASLYDELYVV